MSEKNKPSYWAVLPASVRYDPELPPNAKLLYAELSALADASGYCFAHNEYFTQNFEWSERSIQRLLKALEACGYISIDVIRDEQTNAVIERRVYAGLNPAGQLAPPSRQLCRVEQLDNINNNPLPPKGGRVRVGVKNQERLRTGSRTALPASGSITQKRAGKISRML